MVDRTQRWRRLVASSVASVLVGLGLVALELPPSASAATGPSLCRQRSWFGGQHYCPADWFGLVSNRYGFGRRVWLDQAQVVGVSDRTVEFAFANDCAPEDWSCDNFLFYSVLWEGTHKPVLGAQVRFYGITGDLDMTPTGYVRTGDCRYTYICHD